MRVPLTLAQIAITTTLAGVLLPTPAIGAVPLSGVGAESLSAPSRQIRLLQERLQRYRDGQIREARRITLAQALREGLAAHPLLNRAYAVIEEADWSVRAVRRAWWPQLSVGTESPWSGPSSIRPAPPAATPPARSCWPAASASMSMREI